MTNGYRGVDVQVQVIHTLISVQRVRRRLFNDEDGRSLIVLLTEAFGSAAVARHAFLKRTC